VFEGQTTEEYDYPALYTKLRAFKDNPAYDKENTVNISADMDIPWQIVARTIDATRLKLVEPAYEDLTAYAKAAPLEVEVPDRDGDGKPEKDYVELFPRVVFVVAETTN
jgi:hypothetical protein